MRVAERRRETALPLVMRVSHGRRLESGMALAAVAARVVLALAVGNPPRRSAARSLRRRSRLLRAEPPGPGEAIGASGPAALVREEAGVFGPLRDGRSSRARRLPNLQRGMGVPVDGVAADERRGPGQAGRAPGRGLRGPGGAHLARPRPCWTGRAGRLLHRSPGLRARLALGRARSLRPVERAPHRLWTRTAKRCGSTWPATTCSSVGNRGRASPTPCP